MTISITIRNVPGDTDAELVARAKLHGLSLQAYLRSQLIDMARRPDAKTLMARIEQRKQRTGSRLSAETILEFRDRGRR